MNEAKLKACPFCGEPAAEIGDSGVPKLGNRGSKQAVFCNACYCEGPVADNESDAMDSWNARAGDQQTEAAPNAVNIAGSVSAHGSVDTWKLHILGPDDLIPMESELQALREANMLNIGMARVRQKRPNDPNMPWCMAVVERNGVEYTSDQYPLNAKLTDAAPAASSETGVTD